MDQVRERGQMSSFSGRSKVEHSPRYRSLKSLELTRARRSCPCSSGRDGNEGEIEETLLAAAPPLISLEVSLQGRQALEVAASSREVLLSSISKFTGP